jgi:hypothetical protein
VGDSTNPINPKIKPLANNGGPTKTHAILASSLANGGADPAINTTFGVTTDQRGVSRSASNPDIGAFELK